MMNPSKVKFAYFGTPSVGRDTLAHLIEHGFVPSLVITNPDAPKGRGHFMTPTPTKELALEKGLPILTPEKLDEAAQAEIQKYGCEYAIVVAYGKILPESLIRAFSRGVINVHYSLLPKYRGASPTESALLNGESETGVTIQQMVKELDAGAVIASATTPIEPTETTRELRPRLVTIGSKLLVDTLPAYLEGTLTPVPQDASQATRAPKFSKEDGKLDLAGNAETNWRKYRAFAEWPGTYFFTSEGTRMKITKAKFENGTFIVEKVIPEGGREIDYRRP